MCGEQIESTAPTTSPIIAAEPLVPTQQTTNSAQTTSPTASPMTKQSTNPRPQTTAPTAPKTENEEMSPQLSSSAARFGLAYLNALYFCVFRIALKVLL